MCALIRIFSLPCTETPKPVSTGGRTGLTGFLEGKTGVTGAGTLGVGVVAYLISKEIYIINSETVTALVMGGVIYALLRKVGKPITEYIDDRNQVCIAAYVDVVKDKVTHTHTLHTHSLPFFHSLAENSGQVL